MDSLLDYLCRFAVRATVIYSLEGFLGSLIRHTIHSPSRIVVLSRFSTLGGFAYQAYTYSIQPAITLLQCNVDHSSANNLNRFVDFDTMIGDCQEYDPWGKRVQRAPPKCTYCVIISNIGFGKNTVSPIGKSMSISS